MVGRPEGIHESERERGYGARGASHEAGGGGVGCNRAAGRTEWWRRRGRPKQEVRAKVTETRSQFFDEADRTEQCSKEIVQYQRAEPPGPLLHR